MINNCPHHPFGHRRAPATATPAAPTGSRQRGVTIVLAALSMVAVLMVAAFVASGSLAYSQRRNAQNAADASSTAGARALDRALFFGGSAGKVQATVAGLVADHKAQDFECWLLRTDGGRMVADDGSNVACDNTTTIVEWRVHLTTHRPSADQPGGVEVVVYDEKPTLFGGVGGIAREVRARAAAKATIQSVSGIGAPWVICANPAYAGERGGLDSPVDLLVTTADGPDADTLPDFVFNPDGTVDVDPVKAAQANTLNGNKGIGLDGSKVAECGAGADFDGKGRANTRFNLPGMVRVKQGTGYEQVIQDQILSTNPCPTPLPPVLSGCEVLIPIGIEGHDMQVRVVAAAVFSVTGTGHGQYGYYGKYVGRAQYVAGTHSTIVPPSASSLRTIRLIG